MFNWSHYGTLLFLLIGFSGQSSWAQATESEKKPVEEADQSEESGQVESMKQAEPVAKAEPVMKQRAVAQPEPEEPAKDDSVEPDVPQEDPAEFEDRW